VHKLYTMLQDLSGTAANRFGVLRRPIKQVRLHMKMKDIEDFQQQAHSHYSGMQLSLGTINVYMAIDSPQLGYDVLIMCPTKLHCTAQQFFSTRSRLAAHRAKRPSCTCEQSCSSATIPPASFKPICSARQSADLRLFKEACSRSGICAF
jgi:hypothetical protein